MSTDMEREIARHRYGPHRCVGFFSEGNDRCIVNRLADRHDRLVRAIADLQRYRLLEATAGDAAYLELDPTGPWVLHRDVAALEDPA